MGTLSRRSAAMTDHTAKSEGQNKRIAFALVCGLALCCAVMYVTADGQDETVLAENLETHYTDILHVDQHSKMATNTDLKAVKGLRSANVAKATATGHEISVESVDVKKVGTILTDDTPDGRYLLLDYFKKVEKEIATETAAREKDISALRIQMALTAKHFAKVAEFENKRNKETIARSKKTREIMKKNKASQQHALHQAVLNQQRALATLDQKTKAKLANTQKHIAANAAQIKTNALKARRELDNAMHRFDKKLYNAKKGRSALVRESIQMDKKVRAMVNGKVKAAAAYAAKNFQDVRATMAKDRHHADMMLAQASLRMTTALNAH